MLEWGVIIALTILLLILIYYVRIVHNMLREIKSELNYTYKKLNFLYSHYNVSVLETKPDFFVIKHND